MSGLELNKIAASILLASLIAMIAGFVSNILYKPKLEATERGYWVEVEDRGNAAEQVAEEEPIDIPKLMASANAEAGARVAKKCVACHSFNQGGANKVGPNLWNIVEAKKGNKSDYSYSRILLSAEGVWDQESLFHFLQKPSKYLPGTKMAFAGLRKPEDIANVIAYMNTNAN
jgi:cytochrome c